MHKKKIYDIVFIIAATAIIIVSNEFFGLLEKNIKFLLVPIILASYFIGQFVERKAGNIQEQ